MFDRVEIVVRGGSGGSGVISFRREKFVPLGGPDGGDGGDGGDVIIRVDPAITSLLRFKTKRVYKAACGASGRSGKKHGKEGEDLILGVPAGTVVSFKTQIGAEALSADLEQPGQELVVAKGGKGGFGNVHYVSATSQAPHIAQKGEAGEEKSIILELRLIADVGIIGYPNVGKSTFLSVVSAARPKIASYPFTTLEPVLGVAEAGALSLVIAEIPGLIEGAHLGRGLGHNFLRHIVRTKMLIHLIDGSSASPVENMVRVNNELGLFDSALFRKPQLVVVNKIDLPEVGARLDEIRHAFNQSGARVCFISSVSREGISEVMAEIARMLNSLAQFKRERKGKPSVQVFRPQPQPIGTTVQKQGAVFVVVAPELERLVAGSDLANPSVRSQLIRQLTRLGVSKTLEKAGAKPGDKVRCGDLEWEWW